VINLRNILCYGGLFGLGQAFAYWRVGHGDSAVSSAVTAALFFIAAALIDWHLNARRSQ
jgi:hypothetical protein